MIFPITKIAHVYKGKDSWQDAVEPKSNFFLFLKQKWVILKLLFFRPFLWKRDKDEYQDVVEFVNVVCRVHSW